MRRSTMEPVDNPSPEVEREHICVSDYFANVERARVLMRMVKSDPDDADARHALRELRRNGFDIDAALVLGFDLDEYEEEEPIETPVDVAWTDKLMDEATAFANVGLYERAADRLQTLLRLDPTHEVARAWFHDLGARIAAPPRRADETIRIETR